MHKNTKYTHVASRKRDEHDCAYLAMKPLYDKIDKAAPGKPSGQKYAGRKDDNHPGHDVRHNSKNSNEY